MTSSQLLKNLYLFKDLSTKEIEIIAAAGEDVQFQAGDEVFCKGEPAKYLYLVKRGAVKISITGDSGDSVEVSRIGSGSHFGEMPFLDGEPRSATATVIEPAEIVRFDYDKLSEILIEHRSIAVHFYRQFAIFLCGRLRHTTKDYSYAREKVMTHF